MLLTLTYWALQQDNTHMTQHPGLNEMWVPTTKSAIQPSGHLQPQMATIRITIVLDAHDWICHILKTPHKDQWQSHLQAWSYLEIESESLDQMVMKAWKTLETLKRICPLTKQTWPCQPKFWDGDSSNNYLPNPVSYLHPKPRVWVRQMNIKFYEATKDLVQISNEVTSVTMLSTDWIMQQHNFILHPFKSTLLQWAECATPCHWRSSFHLTSAWSLFCYQFATPCYWKHTHVSTSTSLRDKIQTHFARDNLQS
jgi:hypothetical protein